MYHMRAPLSGDLGSLQHRHIFRQRHDSALARLDEQARGDSAVVLYEEFHSRTDGNDHQWSDLFCSLGVSNPEAQCPRR